MPGDLIAKDLETFRLVKFFTLTGFMVIALFTVFLTLIVADRLQEMASEKKRRLCCAVGRQP